jgi:hypothetical protein
MKPACDTLGTNQSTLTHRFMSRVGWVGFMATLLPGLAAAQFIPTFGKPGNPGPFQFKYEALTYFDQGTDQRGQDWDQLRQQADLRIPAWSGEQNSLSITTRFGIVHTDTDARLPKRRLLDPRRAFPSELYDLRLGANYKHELNNGWEMMLNAEIGSVSDRLFASDEEWLLAGRASLRIPIEGTDDAWLAMIDLSNNRSFLEGVPIPGIAYEMNRGPEFRGLFGVPINYVNWKPLEGWELSAQHILMRHIDVEVAYHATDTLKIYGGYRWWNERYMLSTRDERTDRLWHYEQRLGGGIRWDFLESAWLDFSAGYAFDSYWYLGKDYDDRREGRIDIDDGPYLKLQVGVSF